jgi:pimeloyl-ACP methyl ester carboxylesterase
MIAPQTFVLVHGAWHGNWCWRRVAEALRAGGHLVFTPTLTGLGERARLLHPGLTIEDFATDVANVIEVEELREIILVGHSFGGAPVSVVADRMPERLKQLVFLDVIYEQLRAINKAAIVRDTRIAQGLPAGSGASPYPEPRPGYWKMAKVSSANWIQPSSPTR